MKRTIFASAIVASVNAFLSPLFTDWEGNKPDCRYGPTKCGNDGPCDKHNVCYRGVICTPIQRFTNTGLKCDQGEIQDPLSWGKCIPEKDHQALFCAKEDYGFKGAPKK